MADEPFDLSVEQAAALGAQLTKAFSPRTAVAPTASKAPQPYEWKVRNGRAWVCGSRPATGC
jgi:hypothetical protein